MFILLGRLWLGLIFAGCRAPVGILTIEIILLLLLLRVCVIVGDLLTGMKDRGEASGLATDEREEEGV